LERGKECSGDGEGGKRDEGTRGRGDEGEGAGGEEEEEEEGGGTTSPPLLGKECSSETRQGNSHVAYRRRRLGHLDDDEGTRAHERG